MSFLCESLPPLSILDSETVIDIEEMYNDLQKLDKNKALNDDDKSGGGKKKRKNKQGDDGKNTCVVAEKKKKKKTESETYDLGLSEIPLENIPLSEIPESAMNLTIQMCPLCTNLLAQQDAEISRAQHNCACAGCERKKNTRCSTFFEEKHCLKRKIFIKNNCDSTNCIYNMDMLN